MTVFIIRHAKAQQDSPTGTDFDRPLAPKGELQARFLADQLSLRSDYPLHIASSPAARTLRTAQVIAEAIDVEVQEDEELWLASSPGRVVSATLALAVRGGASGESVAVVSHAPFVSSLIGALTEGPTASGPQVRTGECFVLELRSENPSPEIGSFQISEAIRADA